MNATDRRSLIDLADSWERQAEELEYWRGIDANYAGHLKAEGYRDAARELRGRIRDLELAEGD